MLNFFAYIQKQPLLLLIVSAGVMVAGMVLHSKTTFVTVNRSRRINCYINYGIQKQPLLLLILLFLSIKTCTFVIQKQPLLLLIFIRAEFYILQRNSKTTFVTVNLFRNFKGIISRIIFKNNLCYC